MGFLRRPRRTATEAGLTNLQREYKRLEDRIDAMYVDKLDGRIDADFFDRNAQQWRTKQRLINEINKHRAVNQSYLEEGIRQLELAQRARQLFEKQPACQRRREIAPRRSV